MQRMITCLALPAVALALWGCDVEQTEEGDLSLPEFEQTEPGNLDVDLPEYEQTREGNIDLPSYDVQTGDVDVRTEPETVTVPDVDVEMQEKQVDVPKLDIQSPEENAAEEAAEDATPGDQ